MMWGK